MSHENKGWVRRQRGALMTLDPLHVGSGAYRLSRVDLPIVRDTGTNLPKIPGSSLSGAARAYAAMQYNERKGRPFGKCAGQKGHCGECPVCYTFGSMPRDAEAKEGEREPGKAWAGMLSLFDAPVLLFPVYSMAGTVWVTTRELLASWGFTKVADSGEKAGFTKKDGWKPGKLNLGWLLLETANVTAPEPPGNLGSAKEWNAVRDRLVLLPDKLFAQVVNTNLEVRTSVSISPETGAAEEGALFTYEALPRATWLGVEMVAQQYRSNWPADEEWKSAGEVGKAGLSMAEWLGLGGMGTRGFGRTRLVGLEDQQ